MENRRLKTYTWGKRDRLGASLNTVLRGKKLDKTSEKKKSQDESHKGSWV